MINTYEMPYITYNGGYGEVSVIHLSCQGFNLPTAVTEYDSLVDTHGVVQVT